MLQKNRSFYVQGGYQGWEETNVADTLNVYDNSENRTPIVICIQGGGQTSLNAQGSGWSEGGGGVHAKHS